MTKLNSNQMTVLGIVQVIAAAMCWGTLGIFSTYLNTVGFSGWQITTLRIVTAAILLIAMLPWLWRVLVRLQPKHWLNLSLQSLIGVLGMTVCYFIAVVQVGVAMAVALLYTAPVISLVLAHFLLNEKMNRLSIMLAVLAFVGVALAMSGKDFQLSWGVVFGLLSGVCYACFGVLGKKAVHEKHASHLVFFTSVSVSAAALLLMPATYTTFSSLLDKAPSIWLYVFGLSVLGTITPFWLYMKALEKLAATHAAVFTIFEPLTAIMLSVILLQEKLMFWQTVGIGLIILAALLNALLGTPSKKLVHEKGLQS